MQRSGEAYSGTARAKVLRQEGLACRKNRGGVCGWGRVGWGREGGGEGREGMRQGVRGLRDGGEDLGFYPKEVGALEGCGQRRCLPAPSGGPRGEGRLWG